MWHLTLLLIIILFLMYVNKVEISSQNLYLFLIVILFIMLIDGQYRDQMVRKVKIEGFDT
jgi:hypothetical protein